MKYKDLSTLYDAIVTTSKRLEKTAIIAEFLRHCNEEDLPLVLNLLSGRVFPLWDSRKIGFSSRLLIKAISAATGSSVETIENALNKQGDLGDVAATLLDKKSQQTLGQTDLTVAKVTTNIQKLAVQEGSGTVNKKVGLVAELLSSATPSEAKYISRTVLEVLRVGIAEGILKDAITQAFEQKVNDVDQAFDILADFGAIALHAKKNTLHDVQLTPGKPLKLMLAILAKSVDEGFSAVGTPAILEYKYDGFRLQVHYDGNIVRLFTRNMEEVTNQFPDIVDHVQDHVTGKSFILDCEAVGYDQTTGKYLPFQKISQRIKRKHNTEAIAKQYPVELNVFDILYYNGKNLLNTPFTERRDILTHAVQEQEKKVVLSTAITTDDPKKTQAFFVKAITAGHEGVMFKAQNTPYKPGRYVGYMAKLKEVMDALDLVVVKAEWGEGKRATWLTSYTLACKNGDDLLEIGKVGTGLKEKPTNDTEASFATMTEHLQKNIIHTKGKEVTVKPTMIVEVSYEEIQQSPTYTSGYALRFPRVLRIRYDKPLQEIATLQQVTTLYVSQNK